MKKLPFLPVLTVLLAVGCSNSPWGIGPDAKAVYPDLGTPLEGVTVRDVGQDKQVADTPKPDPGNRDIHVNPTDNGFDLPDTQSQDTGTNDLDTQNPDTGKDETPPQVISAFSTDGKSVTVRFSEPVDPATGGNAANYDMVGSDSSHISVQQAVVNGVFVKLTLDPSAQIDSDLTYKVWVTNVTDLAGNVVDPKAHNALVTRTVYVAILWHQHQPMYLDPAKDELEGPWVRKHAVKDYYAMARILKDYPDMHLTINLTAVMLVQLLTYVDRLTPFLDKTKDRIDAKAFLVKWKGHTDPWVDLLLEPTPDPEGIKGPKPTDKQVELFYDGPWSCLSTSDALLNFFPTYAALRAKNPLTYTYEDLLNLKIYFELAWFHPMFLRGPVKMEDGSVVDLSDVVKRDAKGRFILAVPASEDLANRLLAEEVKIMDNVVAIHKSLRYDPVTHKGQVELTTTPYYHPILPLLIDTDSARENQPYDKMPEPPFKFPQDANAQVARAINFYQRLFGAKPTGMWPGEGSVSEASVSVFVNNNIRWVATDQQVLQNSLHGTLPPFAQYQPYMVDTDHVKGNAGASDKKMAIFFRDTALSNKVGFSFQPLWGQVAASEFLKDVLRMAPKFGGKDRLMVMIMDGENAWESYTKEMDGEGFLRSLYKDLEDAYRIGEIVPVTMSEYIMGNPARNVPPHPVDTLKELEPLSAGSWIGGNFAIWLGEPEENLAWEYLRQARTDLQNSGIQPPDPTKDPPQKGKTLDYYNFKAFDEIYAAEGSDWFWWYGADETSPSNDDSPFDRAFRSHLTGMYNAANQALAKMGKPPLTEPDFAPIIQAKAQIPGGPFTTPPTIDGKFVPNEGEWTAEGGFFYDNDSGTIANPLDDMAQVYYGYDSSGVYVAVGLNRNISDIGTPFRVDVLVNQKHIIDADTGQYTQEPYSTKDPFGNDLNFITEGATWDLRIQYNGSGPQTTLLAADQSGGFKPVDSTGVQAAGPVGNSKLIEIKLPWSVLQMTLGDPLEFMIETSKSGSLRDKAPNLGGKLVFEDVTKLIYVTFQVDVSGKTTAIDRYESIYNPPPPKGQGIVMIAGNQDKLANWMPNKIPLRDDGKGGDKVANDQVWTGVFGFMPGTLVHYKYTIGIPKDKGRWHGTEEFPLTERGFTVSKDPNCHKMIIKDIFADRPQPSDTMGPASTFDKCVK